MTQQDIDSTEAPLIEHLIELRKRLMTCAIGFVVAFIVSFWFSSDILHYLILPFQWGTGLPDVKLISIKLLGVFLVKIKIAFFVGHQSFIDIDERLALARTFVSGQSQVIATNDHVLGRHCDRVSACRRQNVVG